VRTISVLIIGTPGVPKMGTPGVPRCSKHTQSMELSARTHGGRSGRGRVIWHARRSHFGNGNRSSWASFGGLGCATFGAPFVHGIDATNVQPFRHPRGRNTWRGEVWFLNDVRQSDTRWRRAFALRHRGNTQSPHTHWCHIARTQALLGACVPVVDANPFVSCEQSMPPLCRRILRARCSLSALRVAQPKLAATHSERSAIRRQLDHSLSRARDQVCLTVLQPAASHGVVDRQHVRRCT
jgi:hypothetical protein